MTVKKILPLFFIFTAHTSFANTEEIIVTGTYNAIQREQLSSSVTTLNREQLLQLSRHSLVDALRQVPSIWVEEQGGAGGITSISLRGAESNHTLVLLDGVQLNDPTNTRGGAFDVNAINIESIARIEIIRGAQSSVYGSDALAGVIHIITTEAGQTTHQLNASIGEDKTKAAGFISAGNINQIGYALTVQTKDAKETYTNKIKNGSSANNQEAIGKLNWKNNQQQIDINYRYFDGERTAFPEQSGGPSFALSRELDNSHYTDQSSALNWQITVNDVWQSNTKATWYNRKENINSPGIAPFNEVPANGANSDFSRSNFSWINTLGNQKTTWANIGLETKHEKGESKGYLVFFGVTDRIDFSLDRTINSAFFNLNSYATEDLLLQASIRRDDASNASAKNSTQAGMRYQIDPSLSLFANTSQGFKLPSFFALGHPLVGNELLKPETANTQDLGAELTQNNITARISYFSHQYHDLIDFDSDTFKNVNRSRVKTSGIESELTWQASRQWQLAMNATYTDIDMQSSNTKLLGRPQVKINTSIDYTMNDAWNIHMGYLWVDSRFAASRLADMPAKTLNAYNRIDAAVNWKINTQTLMSLQINNMANSLIENDIGFFANERTARVSIDFTF